MRKKSPVFYYPLLFAMISIKGTLFRTAAITDGLLGGNN
jgi:hypothetical protein